MGMTSATRPWVVELDEERGPASGAAYLCHMLLSQKAEADRSGSFARQARHIKPVRMVLRDTQEAAVVSATEVGLRVTSESEISQPVTILAESRHLLVVPQLLLAGRWAIIGPLWDRRFWALVWDLVRGRVVIRGLVLHYPTAMRFLWLINLRHER